MAGSHSAEENPVAINVTAMVDVIFCLCLFFMCSMHFKQLEGKVDAWMPKDRGPDTKAVPRVELEEVRVFIRWSAADQTVSRQVGRVAVTSDKQLIDRVKSLLGDYRRAGHETPPVVIDATPDVPWKDVVALLDLCQASGVERIEFAQPMEKR